MDFRRLRPDFLGVRQRGRALVAIPLLVIMIVVVADLLAPPEVHLGPFLVTAPALTAMFSGPRATAVVGALAVVAQVVVAAVRTTVFDLNHSMQISALLVISAVITFLAHVREVHGKQLTQLRAVSEAAQKVLLRPLPHRIGPLRIASVYLAAEAEAQIGGDLYAAARTAQGTRLLVGDVRGKGLESIGDAALVLGAFRAAAHKQADLPALVGYLEGTVSSELDDPAGAQSMPTDQGEAFITAVVLDVPDTDKAVHLINCGHPAPLLLRNGQVTLLQAHHPAPPLGLTEFLESTFLIETFPFEVGDVILLYTDGVLEARDESGDFYPLADRVVHCAGHSPQALLRHLRHDLLRHVGGCLDDDAAMVAIERLPAAPGE